MSGDVAAVFDITCQGGESRRLCRLAVALWNRCLTQLITLQAVHVPGVGNSDADALSRVWFSDVGWSLNPGLFWPVFS